MSVKTIVKDILANFLRLFPLKAISDAKYFLWWEKKGVHIMPVFCYSPIPEIYNIDEGIWKKKSALIGVNMNEASQLGLLKTFSQKYSEEYRKLKKGRNEISAEYEYCLNNDFFSEVDAEVSYCMIRSLRPKKIIEIGSGYSTYLTAQAILENQREFKVAAQLFAIECNPNPILRKGFPGLTGLIAKKVEDMPIEELTALEAGDILFVDSSHVLRTAGDVQFIFNEIFPRLKQGVIVHIHDIFFPHEYPRKWIMEDHLFWTEQYLLAAFLAFNETFQVIWCASFMAAMHTKELVSAFPSYDPDKIIPKSFWMQRVK